ncbi:Mitochondrial copper homeostasis protein [Lobosporangium transversale]|uniref:Cysteine alpha-hairpin motif superfamily n=1 Tax=Lobosporangium transversale TaxID=64571 RepID=A0A1Y2GKP1_9FUNG|nr:hypothetical protein BCR41DRAFT_355087 [Lobosporangium transversale]KAF9897304.1 Mitochondrial copper homeostasis protein [Lobosporangium transversale]ORZ13865.1 hypothetical protein BCR41DRAFT_355087 [Lobosporangium transversale]|eukprot:XP_021880649.1 hypothetical protein BCR41DRAFT_355087 [Lobosporangium transversale]
MSVEEESKPVYRGNNTTVTSASFRPQQQQQPSSSTDEQPKKGPRRSHEHIHTTDEELKEFNKEYNLKAQSQFMDPCRAQTRASLKCMDENNYDKRRCTRFFKDYSDCKKKWLASLREERRKRNLGIVDDDEASGLNKDNTKPPS